MLAIESIIMAPDYIYDLNGNTPDKCPAHDSEHWTDEHRSNHLRDSHAVSSKPETENSSY